jgi:hypothetical protein
VCTPHSAGSLGSWLGDARYETPAPFGSTGHFQLAICVSTEAATTFRSPIRFSPLAQDPGSKARIGLLETRSGSVETPAFMPVGTQATVKGLTPDQLRATGTRMLLANTYHLALRPGEDEVAAVGGLHAFMGWDGPILTDSGGISGTQPGGSKPRH